LPQDGEEGEKWLKQAAKLGNQDAIDWLAWWKEESKAFKRDDKNSE